MLNKEITIPIKIRKVLLTSVGLLSFLAGMFFEWLLITGMQ